MSKMTLLTLVALTLAAGAATAGFFSHGTMTFAQGVFTVHEKVVGVSEGITEVRSSSRGLEDGHLHTKSEYRKDGQWVSGHEITYVEAPDAEVVFT
jgi:hypothetical protein